jgi:hypothetical protein
MEVVKKGGKSLYINSVSLCVCDGGFGGWGKGEAGEAAGDHHGFRMCMRLSKPVHSDLLTVSTRPILQPPR